MKNNVLKKGLVCALIVLFVGTCIMPMAGSLSIERISTASQIYGSNLGDDTTPPVIEVTWEAFKDGGTWYVDFICEVYDNESGIDRVEMYFNDVFLGVIVGPGPTYDFLVEWSRAFKTAIFKFVAYNGAGLSAFVLVNGSDIKSFSSSQQSTSKPNSQNTVSVIPSIATEIVENKNAETRVSNLESRGAELEVTTDNSVYDPGETVTIYLTNVGDEILYGGGPLITIYNEDEEIVFEEAVYCWHELEPGENITWTWNQTDENGSQVPMEIYKVEGSLFGVGETFVNYCLLAVTNEDIVTHLDGGIGENGWYVSCPTLTILYDPEVIREVRVNGEIYVKPLVFCGGDIYVFYWNGKEETWTVDLDIDPTKPDIDLTWEVSGNFFTGWEITFTAICSDATSGMDRVEFYINNEWECTDFIEPYEWVMSAWPAVRDYTIKATAFDKAGNSASDTVNLSDIKSYSYSQSSITQQSSTPLFFQILQRLMNIR